MHYTYGWLQPSLLARDESSHVLVHRYALPTRRLSLTSYQSTRSALGSRVCSVLGTPISCYNSCPHFLISSHLPSSFIDLNPTLAQPRSSGYQPSSSTDTMGQGPSALQTCINGIANSRSGFAAYPNQPLYQLSWVKPYNLDIKVVPEAVVRPRDTNDVAEVIKCATTHGYKVQARSGGHSFG